VSPPKKTTISTGYVDMDVPEEIETPEVEWESWRFRLVWRAMGGVFEPVEIHVEPATDPPVPLSARTIRSIRFGDVLVAAKGEARRQILEDRGAGKIDTATAMEYLAAIESPSAFEPGRRNAPKGRKGQRR
jgi:hypothetical protein